MAKYYGAYYDGVLRIICTGGPEVVLITGEIDQARYLSLVSTLEDLVDPEGDVHVNLAGLAYCDVAGLRAILRLAGAGRGWPGLAGKTGVPMAGPCSWMMFPLSWRRCWGSSGGTAPLA